MLSLAPVAVRPSSLLRFLKCSLACLALLLAFTACSTNTPRATGGPFPPNPVFLVDAEESVYSEILQKDQPVLLQIELVDTVRPSIRVTEGDVRGFVVPAGNRRVQFRVVLPSTGWNDSHAREARGFVDVALVAGHRYRVAGKYDQAKRTFHLLDMTINEVVSPDIDLGFFGPVERKNENVPILIIPIKV